MERTSTSALNKLYLALAVISLIVSWIPTIDEKYRITLLIIFAVILIIIYYSSYFKSLDKIEEKIEKLENRVDKMEDLINIKSDIELLKKVYKIK